MWGRAVFSSLGQKGTQTELLSLYLTLTRCAGLWGL